MSAAATTGPADARAVQRRLLALSGRTRALLAGAIAAGLAGAALLIVQAVGLARVVDGAAFGGRDLAALRGPLIALAATLAGRAVLAGVTEWLGRCAADHAMAALRRRVAAHVLAVRPARVDEARRGELATAAVHGVDALGDYYAKAVPQLALAAAAPPLLVAVVLWHDPVVGVLLALTVPLVVVFMVLVGRESAGRIDERRTALSVLGAHFLDVVRGLPTLRAHGRAEAQAETLGAIGERYRSESVAALRVAFLSALVLELFAMVGTAVAAAVVGVQLAEGKLGFEAGLVVLLLAPEIYAPLRQAGQRYHAAEDGARAAQALFALLDEAAAGAVAEPADGGRPAPDPARAPLVVAGARVRGGAGRPDPLAGVDATIAPGRMTALIGPSGAGKSTLLAVLARLVEPDAGTVACGGVDLRDVARAAWWRRVAWLPQRPALARGPLRDALTLDRPGATAAELARALERADAAAIVAGLPDGLATPVGAGGRPLSGGQAQRLALAGALLSDAPLLLLDEPTAHLDPDSAARVAAGIRAAAAGRTAVVATHDPALIAACDDVLELRDGRVAAAPALEAAA